MSLFALVTGVTQGFAHHSMFRVVLLRASKKLRWLHEREKTSLCAAARRACIYRDLDIWCRRPQGRMRMDAGFPALGNLLYSEGHTAWSQGL